MTAGSEVKEPAGTIPALRYRFLTRFYDRAMAWLFDESALQGRLVDLARIEAGMAVLDVGCGTGALTSRIGGRDLVVGLDADLEALAIARRKQGATGTVLWCAGSAESLPFRRLTFERVMSSLMFHHLKEAAKRAALGEINRVLSASGRMLVLDWGRARDLSMRAAFLFVQLLDGFATTTDNVKGRLVEMIRDSGLKDATVVGDERTKLGLIEFFEAHRGGLT